MTIRPLKRGLRTYLEHDDRRVSFGPWPRGKPGGVLIHTTGGGIIKMCERLGITPGACVDRVYGNPGMSVAHVAVLPDGEAVQCVAWDKRAPHAGVSAA